MGKQSPLGIIPARYSSTRFPGKLLAPLGGKPLIQCTYENAANSGVFERLVVAADDERIAEAVRSFGGDVVMTSPDCATGTDRLAEVVASHEGYSDYDLVVNIQGDEPFVSSEAFGRLVAALSHDDTAVMSTVAVPFADAAEVADPHAVKVVLDQRGGALYFSRAAIPYTRNAHTAPFYHHVGIYAFRRDFLLRYATLPATPLQRSEDLEQLKVLEHGYRIAVAVVDGVGLGVDTPEDLQKAETYLQLCKT